MEAKEDNPLKRQHRSTLFSEIFSQPKHFTYLLEECRKTPLELQEGDIREFSLDSKFIKRKLRNDVSFITSDNRLIILIEHQSTICVNIAIRLLFYYIELVQMWIAMCEINIFANKLTKESKREWKEKRHLSKPVCLASRKGILKTSLRKGS